MDSRKGLKNKCRLRPDSSSLLASLCPFSLFSFHFFTSLILQSLFLFWAVADNSLSDNDLFTFLCLKMSRGSDVKS